MAREVLTRAGVKFHFYLYTSIYNFKSTLCLLGFSVENESWGKSLWPFNPSEATWAQDILPRARDLPSPASSRSVQVHTVHRGNHWGLTEFDSWQAVQDSQSRESERPRGGALSGRPG